MDAKFPVAVLPCAHCHVTLLVLPSGSSSTAVNATPPCSVPTIVTVPASSSFVRLIDTVIEASTVSSTLPAASLLSCTSTVTW